nr:reverse transcriptase domain-containing protein [Tanacetum cinerariifolium]
MADQRPMAQLLQTPTEGYKDAIVVPTITADNFELKHGLLTLVQNKQFFGHDKEDPHTLVRYFNMITFTLKFPNVLNTSDDLVSKFINQFFPPSKTTNLRNEITNFQQRFDESFSEAWDRFKDLLRAFPHHGFSELRQLDTFYNALNSKDQDSMNSAAGGNFLDKMPRECIAIIERKSKVCYSRNKPVVAKVSTNTSTSGISPDVVELKDMVKALLLNKKGQNQSPAPVKAVEESCVTCGGAHSYHNFPATNGNIYRDNIQEFVSQASTINYNQGNTGYRPPMMSIQIRPPGFPPVLENEPEATKDTVNPTNNRSTEDVQPHVVQSDSTSEPVTSPISEPVIASVHFVDFNADPRVPLILGRSFLKTGRALIDVFKDFNADPRVPLILGRSFLKTGRALIDVFKEQTSRSSANYSDMTTKRINVIDMACEEYSQEVMGFSDVISSGNPTPYYDSIVSTTSLTLTPILNDDPSLPPLSQGNYLPKVRKELKICEAKSNKYSVDEPPAVELIDLPPHLEYAFLEGDDKLPVIIAKDLSVEEKSALITVLKSHKRAIAWKLSDIKGIDPELCTHKILMEKDFEPTVQHQRRVNPKIHDVIKQEVIKHLEAGLIYLISNGPWVSPVHCVPNKGGFTVVENEDNELILTRLVIGWRVCIDYRKLNKATQKDHFPLPFMDQILERLAGNRYYYFLNVFLVISKFPLIRKIRRKPPSPAHTERLLRMPFGLCNAPGMFQRCMMAIFHDMIEKTMEVFMDDFSIFGNSFQICLSHLERMLKRCEDINLCLNWEKSHFMVKEDWDMPFELMCDASDFAIGALLGQRQDKHFRPIHYASKTMIEAKSNYTTTEKEMLAVVKVQINELNELHDQAYENSLIYKEKTKRLHDSKIKNRAFNIGDRVHLFNSRLKIFSGKLKSRWSGPFTISQVYPYGTVVLSQPDGLNFKVNGNCLKHYFGEDIPKVVVPDLQTFSWEY